MSTNSSQPGAITAYPLAWPSDWKRTPIPQRARYGDRSLSEARKSVVYEVRLLHGKNLIISSNIELRLDGLPRSGQKQPADRGVAIYFEYKGRPSSFACDKWLTVEDNLWAIVLGLGSLRQLERCGMSEMLDRAFRGFDALPAPRLENWWEVLNVPPSADLSEIRDAYRALARQHHPDVGGSAEKFYRIKMAYDIAQDQFEHHA